MKSLVAILFVFFSLTALAESKCDLKVVTSVGVKAVEFVSGDQVHSKMAIKDSTADALAEELINLQDMGLCGSEFKSQKCILKYEKANKTNFISLYRGSERWLTWNMTAKEKAQVYVTGLKRFGFCS